MNLIVPGDIAVACFNESLYNEFSLPPITSISVNSTELGEKAAENTCLLLSGCVVGNKNVKVDFKFIPAYKGYPDNAVDDPLGKQVLAGAGAVKQ